MKYIESKLSAELDYVDLYAVSDIHRGHPCFNADAWRILLQRIAKDDHAIMVLAGDGTEQAIKSARHGDTYATMRPREERQTLEEELSVVKDKIAVILPGNHDLRPEKDSDENPIELIAEKLGILPRYDPISAVLDVSFGTRDGTKGRPTSFDFYISHGSGGGRRPGSKVNRMQEWAFVVDGVDGYIGGHVHDLMGRIEMRYSPDPHNTCMTVRPVAYVIPGSFLNYGGYAEAGLYAPSAVSMPRLRLYAKKRTDKHKHMELVLPTNIRTA